MPELPQSSYEEAQKIREEKKLEETDNNKIGWNIPNMGPSAPPAPSAPPLTEILDIKENFKLLAIL